MHRRFFHLMLLTLVTALSWACWPGESVASEPAFERVFVDVDRFEELREEGAAVFDVRSTLKYRTAHVPGAAHTPWESFVDGRGTGLVSDHDGKLTTLLRNAGVNADKPVLIYGNWSARQAWGEEGRLLWMLHYLGHEDVYILQGGFDRWQSKGHTVSRLTTQIEKGDFEIQRKPSLRARTGTLLKKIEADGEDLVLLDTREKVEFEGNVKYGEKRPGHIPGAKHLWWHDLYAADGTIKPPAELRRLFALHGITPESNVVTYCTGGIRSGFVYGVLHALGYTNIQNYDGSMWE
ncbi:MAG: rhodanese-like domain-containing protein, partial [Bradymonadaceae bacterium]